MVIFCFHINHDWISERDTLKHGTVEVEKTAETEQPDLPPFHVRADYKEIP